MGTCEWCKFNDKGNCAIHLLPTAELKQCEFMMYKEKASKVMGGR